MTTKGLTFRRNTRGNSSRVSPVKKGEIRNDCVSLEKRKRQIASSSDTLEAFSKTSYGIFRFYATDLGAKLIVTINYAKV